MVRGSFRQTHKLSMALLSDLEAGCCSATKWSWWKETQLLKQGAALLPLAQEGDLGRVQEPDEHILPITGPLAAVVDMVDMDLNLG
jgi:hypothetical protein